MVLHHFCHFTTGIFFNDTTIAKYFLIAKELSQVSQCANSSWNLKGELPRIQTTEWACQMISQNVHLQNPILKSPGMQTHRVKFEPWHLRKPMSPVLLPHKTLASRSVSSSPALPIELHRMNTSSLHFNLHLFQSFLQAPLAHTDPPLPQLYPTYDGGHFHLSP